MALAQAIMTALIGRRWATTPIGGGAQKAGAGVRVRVRGRVSGSDRDRIDPAPAPDPDDPRNLSRGYEGLMGWPIYSIPSSISTAVSAPPTRRPSAIIVSASWVPSDESRGGVTIT